MDNFIFSNIKNSVDWIKIEPLNKGWSKDIKYHIYTKDNEYLLRISDISLYDKKKRQFELLKEVDKLNINTSKPIDFGILNDTKIYMLLTWLEGKPASEYIKTLSDEDAYMLGIEAGSILQKLHSINIPNDEKAWWDKYKDKIERKINQINSCGLFIPNKDMFIKYVQENMYLVKNRNQRFSHGDYHLGNMIVHNGKVGIIDFDKNTIADPYGEFKPFCWNAMRSEYFETGLINGYFNNQIPNDFFPILALYAVENLISHLPWAISFGEEEIKIAYEIMDSVMKWYDNLRTVKPSWYKGIIK